MSGTSTDDDDVPRENKREGTGLLMDERHDDVPDERHICHCRCACGDHPTGGQPPRPVRAGTGQLLELLGQLHSSTLVTGNQAAALTHLGCYEQATTVGSALPVRAGSATLRLDPAQLTGSVLTEGAATGGTMLSLLGPEGRPVHQVRADRGGDRRLLDGLDLLEPEPCPVIDGLGSWCDGDQLAQLDALVTGQARARRDKLAAVAPFPVRSIRIDVLPRVLEHLSSVVLPVTVGVFAPGVLQLVPGTLLSVQHQRGRVWAILRSSVVDLDLRRVAECLLVRVHAAHGPTSMLELYDVHGRIAAVLTLVGLVGDGTHRAWELLAAALPELP